MIKTTLIMPIYSQKKPKKKKARKNPTRKNIYFTRTNREFSTRMMTKKTTWTWEWNMLVLNNPRNTGEKRFGKESFQKFNNWLINQ